MGWWPWSKDTTSSSTNPLRDLDPSLREFLSKESPVKYKPAPALSPPKAIPQPTPSPTDPNAASLEPTSKSPVPPESLYPDGRYAHLWSTYRPLSDIENESKSDQEKLADVLEGYKARKAQIGRAAVENCVFEQIKLSECYSHGGLASTMTMCRKENKEFERCYVMQSVYPQLFSLTFYPGEVSKGKHESLIGKQRFLKALGYLSTYDRPPEVDEAIQMHADTLYHRMLAQEAALESAKAAGQPEPSFPPFLAPETASNPRSTSQIQPATTNPSTSKSPTAASTSSKASPKDESLPTLSATTQSFLNAASQQKLRERLKDLSPYERELEERSVQMEARTAADLGQRMNEVGEGRKKRREEGNGTAADTVAGWFGW